ncbi:hypothetical protein MSAN_00235200 [Mycena sanguinolenta]|uniref:Uncharacterized protein n=1 Tax=Mycena sanguinolenta TaxID=230812 RepID=A0A8H6ZMC2_9AGAR|nr:hypothetical protein MSAN_00235200 [Mycena sanguinolenta]
MSDYYRKDGLTPPAPDARRQLAGTGRDHIKCFDLGHQQHPMFIYYFLPPAACAPDSASACARLPTARPTNTTTTVTCPVLLCGTRRVSALCSNAMCKHDCRGNSGCQIHFVQAVPATVLAPTTAPAPTAAHAPASAPAATTLSARRRQKAALFRSRRHALLPRLPTRRQSSLRPIHLTKQLRMLNVTIPTLQRSFPATSHLHCITGIRGHTIGVV